DYKVTGVQTCALPIYESPVPIGFDADTAYLAGRRQRLARAVMAAPQELHLIRDIDTFRYVTLLCLLRQRDLRVISVWHPSFLTRSEERRVGKECRSWL